VTKRRVHDDRARPFALVPRSALGQIPDELSGHLGDARRYYLPVLIAVYIASLGLMHLESAASGGHAGSWAKFTQYSIDQLKTTGLLVLYLQVPALLFFIMPLAHVMGLRSRRRAVELCRSLGLCASCGSELKTLEPDPDGCTSCPRCFAAWRLPQPPSGSRSVPPSNP
jgi:hypothetical protein